MADQSLALLNGVNPTLPGTFYSTAQSTKDFRDFAVMLLMPTTTGAGTDTLDVSIEESDQQDFADQERIRAVTLTEASVTGTVKDAFNQVIGGTSSPDATLQQKFNLDDKNINRWIRVKYVIANTATSFTDISVLLLANKKI